MRIFNLFKKKDEKPEDIICPVCGYYCIGKGGFGCIDKLSLYLKDKEDDNQG